MRRRFHWWGILAIGLFALVSFWLIIEFNLIPLSTVVEIDMYSGRTKLTSRLAGVAYKQKVFNNSVGSRYLEYFGSWPDTEQWELVFETTEFLGKTTERKSELYMSHSIYQNVFAHVIDGENRHFFEGPSGGYTLDAKKAILLNSLEILRQTNFGFAPGWYVLEIEGFIPVKRITADVKDIMTVDEFLNSYTGPFNEPPSISQHFTTD